MRMCPCIGHPFGSTAVRRIPHKHETDPSMSRSKLNARTIAAAIAENVAFDVAAAAAAADIVSAIGNAPDSPPATESAVPAPLRCAVGNAAHVNLADVHAVLRYNETLLNGHPAAPRPRDALTVVPMPSALTADDAPLLYARAATLLTVAASASVNAPNRIGASPLDRMQFLARAAERCIYAADRHVVGTRPVRAFSGGFNGTEPTRMRIASLAAVLNTLPSNPFADVPHASLPTADICDAPVVAYLAARKTATRPDGGYFARNVGTIDR